MMDREDVEEIVRGMLAERDRKVPDDDDDVVQHMIAVEPFDAEDFDDKPCRVIGVPKGTPCACQAKRKAERQAVNDAARGSAASRGYDGKWARESKAWLAALAGPLCACGCGGPANMVDHILAPKGDMRLFWDRSNWQPFSGLCNRRKNIRQEGGFGR